MLPTATSVRFDGKLLRRGFWIYAWRIVSGDRTVFYVGRTGDSSSCNAASPFNRIGTHLDARPNAKANSLTRCLLRAGMEPAACSFHMAAVGPLFPEQSSFDSHRPVRDKMAALEHNLAAALRKQGHEVLGSHTKGRGADPVLVAHLLQQITTELGARDA